MKKITFSILAILFLYSTALMAQSSESSFSKKGTLEFGGSFGFNYSYYPDKDSWCKYYVNFCFSPDLNYYFADSLHAGIVPSFSYQQTKYRDTDYESSYTEDEFDYGPRFSIGYTLGIRPDLFFDITPAFTYYGTKIHSSSDNVTYNTCHSSVYSITFSLKYVMNSTIINIKLIQDYRDYNKKKFDLYEDYHTYLGVGVTSFINL